MKASEDYANLLCPRIRPCIHDEHDSAYLTKLLIMLLVEHNQPDSDGASPCLRSAREYLTCNLHWSKLYGFD
jgi:hypothetical protein